MGVSYNILPFKQSEDYAKWLAETWNIKCPKDLIAGRNPTIKEIQFVLDNLTSYKILYSETLSDKPRNMMPVLFRHSSLRIQGLC